MSDHSSHFRRSTLFRRLWKPVTATGAGGTAVVIWFDEIIAFSQEILGLIFLSILGAAVCLLDNFVFKSRIPRREDMKNAEVKGAKE
jgi:hypothetical protein